jgi:glycosyltransferase involved in cell wall biosynthesis
MKIAMVTSDYLPNIGGIASHITEISQAMTKLGHSVKVWFWDSKNREPVFFENVPTELLQVKPISFRPRGLWYSISLVKVLREKIMEFEPEILHVHTLAPLSLSMRWLGAGPEYRRILTNHSSSYLMMIRSWLGRQEAKFYCSGLDGLLAPSQELLDKSDILGLDDKRRQYIPNGVDAEKFAPGDKHEARARLNLPNDKFVILATRRFAVKNGLRYLALALDMVRKQVPETLCVFCGNAADNEELPTVKKIVSQ